jgi:hypothetical protein
MTKKLTLHRETLRHLCPAQLRAAGGGLTATVTCPTNHTCPSVLETVCTLRCTE